MRDEVIADNKYFKIDQDSIFGTVIATNISWGVPKDKVPKKLLKKYSKYIN